MDIVATERERRAQELLRLYRANPCNATLEPLLEHLRGLVVMGAQRIVGLVAYDTIDDLVQVGLMPGATGAIARYDPSTGVPLVLWVYRTAYYVMCRHMGRNTWLITPPDWCKEWGVKLGTARRRLGADATEEAMAQALGLSVEEFWERCEVYDRFRHPVSLDAGRSGPYGVLGDVMGTTDPALMAADVHVDVERALERLSARQRDVIRMYYYGERTLEEIAARLGLTRQRVQQIRADALTRLGDSLAHLA